MILQLVTGSSVEKAADYWHLSTRTVRKWADRYRRSGLRGLFDLPRSGRPQVYQMPARLQVVALACQYPGEYYLPGVTHWSVRDLARVVGEYFREIGRISKETVRRILRAHRLKPHRVKYFLTRTDPNFFIKAKAVVELYLSPPQDGLVICVDERTGIQALERKHPGLPMIPGHCERREFEYVRHGAFCLIAGLNILTGQVFGQCYERHTNVEFRDFLEKLLAAYPGKKLYIILDNLKTHLHENVRQLLTNSDLRFVFLPFHGSWLNQIEIWFGILNQHCIKRADFKDKEAGMDAVMKFVDTWDKILAHPFEWKFNVNDLEKLTGIEQTTLPKQPTSVA